MKFTNVLHKQHIGRAIRWLWQTQRERPIQITKAEGILASMNIPVKDALEFVQPKKLWTEFDFSQLYDNVQSDWKERSCLIYKDHNVLQEGISQACLLTKTLQVNDELPEKITNLETDIPEDVDKLINRIIYTSTIYDGQQIKLPKLKDPNRPSWVFPRVYGISSTRKMHNLSKKFLQLCESLCGLKVAGIRSVTQDGDFSTCIEKESDLLQFALKMDLMLTSLKPLTPIADVNAYSELNLPEIYPMHHTIGLSKTNEYKTENIHPINVKSALMNVHTIFVNHDPEEVKNLTELPVTENQIHARSMIKSFTAAAVCAKQKFGANIKELPEPITVQCIQSNGQTFHFSVYQLNTLDIDGTEGVKNFWWTSPSIKLYDVAQYENGKPCVKGYNSKVFERFLAFYKNK